MFKVLKDLFNAGALDRSKLEVAVSKGWITEAQLEEIAG